MRKVLFDLPWTGLAISSFSVALALACFAALRITAWRARREGLSVSSVYDLAFWLISGGFIGARLLFLAVHPETLQSPLDVFKVWQGGIVLYGSIIGGTLAFFGYRLLRPFPLRPFLVVIAPALVLGIAVGRFGCFLNGCCYGDVCSLPWAVSFPEPSAPWGAHAAAHLIAADAHWSLPVHPTQLYSVIDGLLLMILLLAYFPLRKRDGQVMALLMMTYPLTRILIEYLRSDELIFFAGMTISQNISLVLLACGAIFWYALSRGPAVRYADTAGELPRSTKVATAAAH